MATGGEESFNLDSFEEESEPTRTVPTVSIRTEEEKKIHIVLAGKSGSGKSTLASNIFQISRHPKELTSGHGTTKCETEENSMHGVTIYVTDTVGLEESKGKTKELKKLAKHLKEKRKVDVLIYCVSVTPAVKFHDANPSIMKCLHYTFGSKIWNHCILVFTFSNDAWRWCEENCKEDERKSKYEKYINEYATKFKEELEKLKVRKVSVRPIFDLPCEQDDHDEEVSVPADEELITHGDLPKCSANIVAIPAGNKPDDPVLSQFTPRKCAVQVGDQYTEFILEWKDVIFIEIVKKCSDEVKKNLLRYRYGHNIRKALARGGTSGVMVGAGIGGAAGALAGIVGGPILIACGAAAGVVVGAVAGGTIGSTIVAKKRQKK